MTRRSVYPFKDMQIGDQFAVEIGSKHHLIRVGSNIRSAAHQWAEREFARRAVGKKSREWKGLLPRFSVKLAADRLSYIVTRMEDE